MTDVISGILEGTRTGTDPEETLTEKDIVIATEIGKGRGTETVIGTETTETGIGTGTETEAEIEEAKEAGAGSELGGTGTGAGCISVEIGCYSRWLIPLQQGTGQRQTQEPGQGWRQGSRQRKEQEQGKSARRRRAAPQHQQVGHYPLARLHLFGIQRSLQRPPRT